ncbi:MAG: IS66 family transposase [Rhodoferax sp.]|nr:IS66 family transposase [Rhodoferax sp.]
MHLETLTPTQLQTLALSLIERINEDAKNIQAQSQELKLRQTKIDALTHEIRLLRHLRFAAKTEAMDALQVKLFEEANAEDLADAQQRLAQLGIKPAPAAPKGRPARQRLPANLPRIDIAHEPDDTTCACGEPMKRISEDVSERLDYVPGVFRVERHVRGVWACKCCAHLRQEAMPAQVIESGIPTARLLAQVLIAKYDDHLPLYRQNEIYARSGVDISGSTLADWVGACGVALAPIAQALKAQLLQCQVLHADESPITILGGKGDKKRGYIWAYACGVHESVAAVVFQVKEGRSGRHARDFLQHAPPVRALNQDAHAPPPIKRWSGHLVVDDYGGYKALFVPGAAVGGDTGNGDGNSDTSIIEVGCWAHVRCKFFELHVAAKSTLAETALAHIGALYALEREIRDEGLDLAQALERRQGQSLPRLAALHDWLKASREQVTDGTATAKAMDYTLKRWPALVRYASDARLPIDNNRIENQIRPWAVGRKNWLFSGSLAAGARAADIMSLIQTAKMNGIEPLAYLTDVLTRLPTHPNSRIDELLPTRWQPAG